MEVTLLAGGYGGARMAHGFALLGESEPTLRLALTIVGNTGDDLELHGLSISPDLDTVMYTLAGLANAETGWGVRDETWSASAMLERYGAPTWFRLGDRDLATHLTRTAALREGASLTAVTQRLAAALGIGARLLPMTDASVRTQVLTADGWLAFQDWFVRREQRDDVLEVRFAGIDRTVLGEEVREAIVRADLLVVAPSNPFVSVAPILAVPGLLDAVRERRGPVVGISPIVGGVAVRGPAGRMFASLGGEASAAGVARHYAERYPGLLDMLVIDRQDAAAAPAVEAEGIRAVVAPTVMTDDTARRALAADIVAAAPGLGVQVAQP